MSEVITFDSHKFVKRLIGCGFTERQAEVLAEEQVNLLNSNLVTDGKLQSAASELKTNLAEVKSDLEVKIEAVKSDLEVKIEAVKSDLEVKIEAVKSDLEVKIEAVKSDLLKWMFGAVIAQVGLTVTLIQLLK